VFIGEIVLAGGPFVQRLLIDLEADCIPAPDVIVAPKEKR
jgi:hypothetical protein